MSHACSLVVHVEAQVLTPDALGTHPCWLVAGCILYTRSTLAPASGSLVVTLLTQLKVNTQFVSSLIKKQRTSCTNKRPCSHLPQHVCTLLRWRWELRRERQSYWLVCVITVTQRNRVALFSSPVFKPCFHICFVNAWKGGATNRGREGLVPKITWMALHGCVVVSLQTHHGMGVWAQVEGRAGKLCWCDNVHYMPS